MEKLEILKSSTSRPKCIIQHKKTCLNFVFILQDDATFTITVDGKTFHFQAQDSEERERWIRALEETVLRLVALLPPFFRCLKRKKGFLFVFPGNLEILI